MRSLPSRIYAHCLKGLVTNIRGARPTFPFLSLPGEIRELIYEHVIANTPILALALSIRSSNFSATFQTDNLMFRDPIPRLKVLPNLAFTNRQMFFEILTRILSIGGIPHFDHDGTSNIKAFIEALPPDTGHILVRALTPRSYASLGAVYGSTKYCAGGPFHHFSSLTVLTLGIGPTVFQERTTAAIMEHPGVVPFFQFPQLREINLFILPETSNRRSPPEWADVLHSLWDLADEILRECRSLRSQDSGESFYRRKALESSTTLLQYEGVTTALVTVSIDKKPGYEAARKGLMKRLIAGMRQLT